MHAQTSLRRLVLMSFAAALASAAEDTFAPALRLTQGTFRLLSLRRYLA